MIIIKRLSDYLIPNIVFHTTTEHTFAGGLWAII